MRCWRIAGASGRTGILALSVAALSALLITAPPPARAHSGHRHRHFARRHEAPLRATPATAAYGYGFTPSAWRDGWEKERAGHRRLAYRETRGRHIAGNAWTWQDGWNAPHAFGGYPHGGYGENGFSQDRYAQRHAEIDGMAAQQASAAGVPLSLVERVIKRESGGNPRAVSRGNYGLMQIRLGTARAMGYTGSAAGLLDPQTNMTYAVRYLAGAYRAAGGDQSRAVALYARGYYRVAKAQGFSPYGSSYNGSYMVASNSFGAPGFGFQPAWQAAQPYAGAPPMRWRRHWRRPV